MDWYIAVGQGERGVGVSQAVEHALGTPVTRLLQQLVVDAVYRVFAKERNEIFVDDADVIFVDDLAVLLL